MYFEKAVLNNLFHLKSETGGHFDTCYFCVAQIVSNVTHQSPVTTFKSIAQRRFT